MAESDSCSSTDGITQDHDETVSVENPCISSTSQLSVNLAFRWVNFFLKITGLTWGDKKDPHCRLWFAYVISVNIASWTVPIRLSFGYKEEFVGPLFVNSIIIHTFYICVCCVSALFLYKYTSYWPGIVKLWDQYRLTYPCMDHSVMTTNLIRLIFCAEGVMLTMGTVITCLLVNYGLGYVEFISSPLFYNCEWPPHPLLLTPVIIHIIFIHWVFIQPLFFLCAVSLILHEEFTKMNTDLKCGVLENAETHKQDKLCSSCENDETKKNQPHIEDLRKRHYSLCKICHQIDDMTCLLTMIVYFTNIILVITLLFVSMLFTIHTVNMEPRMVKELLVISTMAAATCVGYLWLMTYMGMALAEAVCNIIF